MEQPAVSERAQAPAADVGPAIDPQPLIVPDESEAGNESASASSADAEPGSGAGPGADAEPEQTPELEQASEPQADAESEPDAESALDSEQEPEPGPDAEPAPEPGPDAETEPAPEAGVEAEREAAAEFESALVSESDVEPGLEPESGAGSVLDADAEPESGPEPEPDLEPTPESESIVEPTPEPEPSVPRDPAEGVASVGEPASPPRTLTELPAVDVRGLTKSFGVTLAVDAIDLVIPAGSFFGIVGPNGAGKTTTLSMIAGLLRPDAGTITVAGIDLAAAPRAAKRQIGILPDRLRTFDRLTGRQLLYYYGVLRGMDGSVVESRALDLARAFDFADALARPVSDYSAGMTKKIMLAGAMIHSPRVLVLDEPFEAMDPVSSAVILEILAAYVARGGTVVLSSHGMEFVEKVCSGVAVIVAGQVLASGTVDQVRGELTLEQRFVQLAGGMSDVEGLEWLHSFSD